MPQQRGAAPTAAKDTATKEYVDGRTPVLSGTTSQRDTFYGSTPATGARWFNTDQLWDEVYLPAKAAADSFDTPRTAGWYPIAGALPRIDMAANGVAQSIPSGSVTIINFTQASANGGMKMDAASPGIQVTLPYTGRWAMLFTGYWPTGNTGKRELNIRVNNVSYGIASVFQSASDSLGETASIPSMAISAGAQVTFRGYQTQGSAQGFTPTRATITYLGPI